MLQNVDRRSWVQILLVVWEFSALTRVWTAVVAVGSLGPFSWTSSTWSNPTSCVGFFSPDQCLPRVWTAVVAVGSLGPFSWTSSTWSSWWMCLRLLLVLLHHQHHHRCCGFWAWLTPGWSWQVCQPYEVVSNHSGLHCPSLPNKHKYLGICSCAMLLLCLCTQMFLLPLRQSPFRGINGGT